MPFGQGSPYHSLYANGERMKYLSLLVFVLISGCSSQPISHQIADGYIATLDGGVDWLK